jgi:hypothetical protein
MLTHILYDRKRHLGFAYLCKWPDVEKMLPDIVNLINVNNQIACLDLDIGLLLHVRYQCRPYILV